MYSTYHLASAQDLNADILEAIKAAYQSKPITIIVEDDTDDMSLTVEQKQILDDRLAEDGADYLPASQSVERLKKKHGL